MSTTATATPAPARPALSTSVIALLRILTRGAAREHFLELHERGGSQNTRDLHLPVHQLGGSLPEPVLALLERSLSPCDVGLAVRRSQDGPLATVSALAVRREFPRVCLNPSKPASPHGRQWVYPMAEVHAWVAQLEALSAPPSLVVGALPAVVALWALDAPLPVRSAGDQAAVMDVLRRLAGALGGIVPEPDATLADVAVPLPGTHVRNLDAAVVEALRLDAGREYRNVSTIEAAIAAKGRK